MSEMGDSYDPGPWRGYSYTSARAPKRIDPTAGRGYGSHSARVSRRLAGPDRDKLCPANIATDAKSPLVIVVDGTGSMGKYPEVMFKKLPLLDLGIEDYLQDCEISFAMVGDAGSDHYPLQVQPFTKGKKLVGSLNNLIIEGNGGGNQQESYDLAGLYYARNCKMPKATNPVLIWVCDEGIYGEVDKAWAEEHARVTLDKKLRSLDLWKELQDKFAMYCIRKHYEDMVDGDRMVGANLAIHRQWEQYVGADKIALLPNPERVVDVIFGLVAHHTGKEDFFQQELTYRQKPGQVKEVNASMVSIGKGKGGHTGASIVKRSTRGTTSQSLL